MKHLAKAAIPGSIALLLWASCAIGPNYKRPEVNTPVNYRFATSTTTNSVAELGWKEVFTDATLQELIAISLANNYDLKQAAARVEQARNLALAARAPLFPPIGYGGDIGRGRNALFNSPAALDGTVQSSAQINISTVWELDFWGRIRRMSEAARARYFASEEARQAITITLVSDVASAYYRLLDLDQELAIQRAATNAYAGSFRIFDDRRINGVASKLETDRAAASLANAAAAIPELELQIAITEDQLSVLLGRNPGPINRLALTNQPAIAAEVPAGLPSDLLRRRPDIRAAEQLLVAANADIGARLADFFPKIGLTTFLGKVSPELSAFTAGSANAWSVGGTLSGPIFRGGEIRANYMAAKAKFEESKAAYQQTVLDAFQEVADYLANRQKLGEMRVYDEQAVEALVSAVQLATDRYLAGKSSYYEVLQAQQELYPAQRAQIQAWAGELIATAQLYRALGGGWEPPK